MRQKHGGDGGDGVFCGGFSGIPGLARDRWGFQDGKINRIPYLGNSPTF